MAISLNTRPGAKLRVRQPIVRMAVVDRYDGRTSVSAELMPGELVVLSQWNREGHMYMIDTRVGLAWWGEDNNYFENAETTDVDQPS